MLAFVAGNFLAATSSHAALADPQTLCSVAKAKAASAAFSCRLRQDAKLALGGNGDPASCDEKLQKRFAKAEGRWTCATTGDATLAASRAATAATDVLNALGAGTLAGDEQEKCFAKKAKLAGRYGICQAAALINRITNNYIDDRADFLICRVDHQEKSEALDSQSSCATTSESDLIQELSGLGYGFFPATSWTRAGGELELNRVALPHAYLVGATFEFVDLELGDFRGADLSNAELRGVDFNRGVYVGTDFRGATLTGAVLEDVTLDADLLDGADMSGATLTRVKAKGVVGCPASLPAGWMCAYGNLLGPTAVLRYVDLSNADLTGVELSDANIQNSSFANTILQDSSFSGAAISASNFEGADLAGASFDFLFLTDSYGASLVECPSTLHADWRCAANNLVGSTIILRDCSLAGADLSGLFLRDVLFLSCDLSGASFALTTFDECFWADSTCPDLSSSNSNGGTCCGHHVGTAPMSCSN